MPATDTAFLIGVIREWEKSFLEDDEYTRLIEAPGLREAQDTLRDTPYGGESGQHIKEVHDWIGEMTSDERVWQFISARYDALNAASALLDKMDDKPEPGQLSELGTIPASLWQSVVWNDLGWDKLPEFWSEFIRAWKDSSIDKTKLLKVAAMAELTLMKKLAFTPLMKEVVAWREAKAAADKKQRSLKDPASNQETAWEYERGWDEKLMEIIRQRRLEPVGHDSVLAFWYGKELEVKGVRQLLAAKAVKIPKEQIRERQMSLYRAL